MRPTTDPDLTVQRAAQACEDARLAARSASRTRITQARRSLILAAINHLDAAQDKLFEAAGFPWQRPTSRAKQLKLEGML